MSGSSDNTNMKRELEDLRQQKKTLEKQLSTLRSIMELSGGGIRKVLHSLPEAVTICTLEGIITDISEFDRILFGLEDKREAIGTNILDWVHQNDLKTAEKLFQAQVEKSLPQKHQMRLRRGEDWFWAVIKTSLFVDVLGRPVAVILTINDVTNEKMAMKIVRDSEIRLRSILDATIVGFGLSKGREIVFVNTALTEILGYDSPEDMKGLSFLDLIVPEDRNKALDRMTAHLRGEEIPLSYTQRMLKKGGTVIDVEIYASPVMIDDDLNYQVAIRDITESLRTQRRLAESERRFREMTEDLPETVFETDDQGQFTFVNHRGLKLFGYDMDDLERGIHILDVVVKKDIERIKQRIIQALASDRQFSIRHICIKKDGTTFPGMIHVNSYQRPDGKRGFRGFVTDISAIVEKERALSESEEKFRAMTEQSLVGIIIIQDGRIIYANEQFQNMTGYSLDEMSSWNKYDFTRIIAPENRDLVITRARNRGDIEEEQHRNYRFKGLHRDGTERWVELWSKPINFGENMANLYLILDIHQQFVNHEALKKSEQRFRVMADLMPQAVYETDKDFNLTFINRFGLDNYGYTDEDFRQGLNIRDLFDEAGWSVAAANLEAVIGGNPPQNPEYRIYKKTGEPVDVLIYADRIVENGEFYGLRGMVLDVTDLRQAESEREQLRKRVIQSRRMESLGTLASGLAHDFNNLLSPVLGFAEVSREMVEDGSVLGENLDMIVESVKNARDLVQQILMFSGSDGSGLQPLQLDTFVGEAMGLVRSSIPETAEIDMDLEPLSRPVPADPARIHRILVNLTRNSFDALPEGRGRIRIGVREITDAASMERFDVDSPCALLYVEDNGAGIPPEELDLIFEPFFTTKPGGQGTGLGLFVVHGIVENMKGSIRVENLDPGTGINIILPFQSQELDSHITTTLKGQR